MKPSLDASYLRVKRAGQHIKALEVAQNRIKIDPADIVRVDPDPQASERGPNVRRRFQTPRFILPETAEAKPMWAIRFGEAIYNLRAALDYLVYSLAHLDSGQPQDGTQFPITSTEAIFNQMVDGRRSYVTGVSQVHLAQIEALQPYQHGFNYWLARLAELSNPDKHRHLTIIQNQVSTITAWHIPAAPGREMDVDFQATRVIRLSDGLGALETLRMLLLNVTETLDQFKPDFLRK